MANKKFSEFDLKTSTADVDFVVGYDGTDNVRISPANLAPTAPVTSVNSLTGAVSLGLTQLDDVGSDGTNGQVLTTNGSGSFTFATAGGGGASSLNGLTDCLVDTGSLYVGEVPAGLSGNPQGNTILGIDAGNALTTGTTNVAIGFEALSTATATNNKDCVAIGYRALKNQNALVPARNIAIGFEAGRDLTTVNGNVLIGSMVSRIATTGTTASVVVGNFAMYSNSGAAKSVVIGHYAGSNGSGGDGVSIGYQAGQNNTNVGHHSIGYQAGFSQSSGASNTNLGFEAGYSNTTGASRVMLGYEAGRNNTGSNNVFLGKATGKGTGSGSQCVAIGQGVMEAGSAANNSVFIGNFMAYNTTSGADSTVAIGTNCLSVSGYSGEANTVVGHQAANNLSSGDNNTLIGYKAGFAASTGASNTLIGYEAGLAITTAGNNVLIGYQSGKSLVAGSNSGSNVFVGYQTGFGANNANYNTLLGYQTGYGLTNGENNTIIGSFASAYGGALTTGDNNTIIGNAAYPSAATVSNEITLGNSSISALRCAVTSITSLSDERDKSDIRDITYGLAFIDALQPREFVWNNRPEIKTEIDEDGNETQVEFYSSNKGKKDFGFIAQEVKELDNDTLRLVYSENEEKLELSYGKLVPILVKAIQELKEEIELLKS